MAHWIVAQGGGKLVKFFYIAQKLFLETGISLRISVLIKQGQRFGVVCETEMSATRNSCATLICMNVRTHRYKIFVERWPESCLCCV